MDDNDRRVLAEFHVTPLIEHAVKTLRALIPPGHEEDGFFSWLLITREPDGSIGASLNLGTKGTIGSEGKAITLNNGQRAAFELLEVTAAYHWSLIKAAWTNMHVRSPKKAYAPDVAEYGIRAAGMAFEDAEQKLGVTFFVLGGAPEGFATVKK